jgi:hypothetical protein
MTCPRCKGDNIKVNEVLGTLNYCLTCGWIWEAVDHARGV